MRTGEHQRKQSRKGGQKCTNLIEASMYDTTHVNYISMVSEELKWFAKEEDCLNIETGMLKNDIPTVPHKIPETESVTIILHT